MDSSNNNFKSFDDQNTDLPEGFGWEDMKEGVYAKMPPKKKRRVAAWWWFGAAGVLALSFATWMLLADVYSGSEALTSDLDPVSTSSKIGQLKGVIPIEGKPPHSSGLSAQEEDFETNESVSNGTTAEVPASAFTSDLGSANEERTQSVKSNVVQLSPKPVPQFNAAVPVGGVDRHEEQSGMLNLKSIVPKDRIASSASQSNVVEGSVDVDRSETQSEIQKGTLVESEGETGYKAVRRSNLTSLVLLKRPFTELKLESTNAKEVQSDLDDLSVSSIEVISLKSKKLFSLPHLSLINLFNPKSTVPSGDFVFVEALFSVPTSTISSVNAPYLTPWYDIAESFSYQRQFKNRFGFSVQYSHQELKQEFAFSELDTITGSNQVDRRVDFVNSTNLALLSSSTVRVNERFARQRDVLSYNVFSYHQLSLFAHYAQPINLRTSLDFGLGGSAQYLGSARGIRLNDTRELINLEDTYRSGKRFFGTLDARLRYVYQFSPKFAMSVGVNYTQALRGTHHSSMSLATGVRWKF